MALSSTLPLPSISAIRRRPRSVVKPNREKILGEVVHVIREFQPDVIILRWTGTNADGHGHHQASAILGREAFDAAADPQRFPGDRSWKAKRLMVLSRAKADVAVPVGAYDPLLGYSGHGDRRHCEEPPSQPGNGLTAGRRRRGSVPEERGRRTRS